VDFTQNLNRIFNLILARFILIQKRANLISTRLIKHRFAFIVLIKINL